MLKGIEVWYVGQMAHFLTRSIYDFRVFVTAPFMTLNLRSGSHNALGTWSASRSSYTCFVLRILPSYELLPRNVPVVLVLDNLRAPTRPPRSRRYSICLRPRGSPRSYRSTTHPNAAAGSTLRRSSSMSSADDALSEECRILRPSKRKWRPGRSGAML